MTQPQSGMSAPRENIPILIAHRGYPARYPENSLEGISAALDAGACFVEFDVQLSSDGVPIVIHDENLQRTAGVGTNVLDTPLVELEQVCIGQPARFGNAFSSARISTLAQIIALLPKWPEAKAFVEIKRAGLRRFGIQTVVPRILDVLRPALDQCIVISFNSEAVAAARSGGAKHTGWAVEEWGTSQRDIAIRLAPDYLFCKVSDFPAPPEPLWPGPWNWAAYQTDDPQVALDLAVRGIAFVETDDIGGMLRHPMLMRRACGPKRSL